MPRMFAALTGLFTQHSGVDAAEIGLPNFFATKLVLVGYLFIAGIWLRNAHQQQALSNLTTAAATSVGLLSSAIIIIGETMQEYSHLPYLVINQFTVEEFLNAAFPLAVPAAGLFVAGFVVFIVVLFAVLYVAYIKK